jgi:hypothetical protein
MPYTIHMKPKNKPKVKPRKETEAEQRASVIKTFDALCDRSKFHGAVVPLFFVAHMVILKANEEEVTLEDIADMHKSCRIAMKSLERLAAAKITPA